MPFVSGDLFACCSFVFYLFVVWCFSFSSSDADGQKRKKSLRRKLDSLAKEKSKDKGTPSSFKTPVHGVLFFSPSVFRVLFFCHNFLSRCRGWVRSEALGQADSEATEAVIL